MQFKISLFVQMPGPPPSFGSNSQMPGGFPGKCCWSFELILNTGRLEISNNFYGKSSIVDVNGFERVIATEMKQ